MRWTIMALLLAGCGSATPQPGANDAGVCPEPAYCLYIFEPTRECSGLTQNGPRVVQGVPCGDLVGVPPGGPEGCKIINDGGSVSCVWKGSLDRYCGPTGLPAKAKAYPCEGAQAATGDTCEWCQRAQAVAEAFD